MSNLPHWLRLNRREAVRSSVAVAGPSSQITDVVESEELSEELSKLYSTEGAIGMKVIADPYNASLE